jgi:hypothetical protein
MTSIGYYTSLWQPEATLPVKVHGPDKARQLCETLSLDEFAGQLHR